MVPRDSGQGTPPSGIRLRAFPLGLLAPRFLRAPHLRTTPVCGRCGAGVAPVWGEEGLLPPASPRLVRPLCGAPGRAGQGSANRHRQPPTSCSSMRFAVSLPLRYLVASVRGGAHPWSTAALAEMPEGEHLTSELLTASNHCSCACPSLPCAHTPPTKDSRACGRGSLELQILH